MFKMDPPGSLHVVTSTDNDDTPQHSNNVDDDAVDQECNYETNERKATIKSQESISSNAVDDDFIRSSLSAARRNYNAYKSMGGHELTNKLSVGATPAVVVQNQSTSSASNPPIFAEVVQIQSNDNDPLVVMTSPHPELQPLDASSSLQSHLSIEQINPQQEKYNVMVHRLVSEQNYPCGLAKRLVTCVQTQFVKHYWLVDNSGSMLTTDCVRMIQKDVLDVGASNLKNGRKLYETAKCSRWNELESAIISHIDVASILEVPTTFRLLQGNMGMQEFTINHKPGDAEAAKLIVKQSKPNGVTLLSDHIHEICIHIEEEKDVLLKKGQKAVVVIATDAIPSDQYGETSDVMKEIFLSALKKLQLLPVWIVIRLCTTDRRTLQYYRKLDKKLEIPIECVSDYITESKEVRKWNPWLNYSLQLHQCRETGFDHRVFDLLDECPLTKDDLLEFLMVLFGEETFGTDVAPNMHTDWNDFLNYLKNQVLNKCEKQYSPTTRKFEDIIDVKCLAMAHGLLGTIRNTINKIDI